MVDETKGKSNLKSYLFLQQHMDRDPNKENVTFCDNYLQWTQLLKEHFNPDYTIPLCFSTAFESHQYVGEKNPIWQVFHEQEHAEQGKLRWPSHFFFLLFFHFFLNKSQYSHNVHWSTKKIYRQYMCNCNIHKEWVIRRPHTRQCQGQNKLWPKNTTQGATNFDNRQHWRLFFTITQYTTIFVW